MLNCCSRISYLQFRSVSLVNEDPRRALKAFLKGKIYSHFSQLVLLVGVLFYY